MTNWHTSMHTHIFRNGPFPQNLQLPATPVPAIPFLGFILCFLMIRSSSLVESGSAPSLTMLVLINIVPGIRAISINSSGVSFAVSGTEANLNFGGRISGGWEYGAEADEVDELRPRTDLHRDIETVGEDGGDVNGFIIDRLLTDLVSSGGSPPGIVSTDVAVAEVDGREMISPVIGPVVRLLADLRRLNARRIPLLTVLWRFTSEGGDAWAATSAGAAAGTGSGVGAGAGVGSSVGVTSGSIGGVRGGISVSIISISGE